MNTLETVKRYIILRLIKKNPTVYMRKSIWSGGPNPLSAPPPPPLPLEYSNNVIYKELEFGGN